MYTRFFRWASDRLHDDGILAFITNRNFIEKAAFDGFRRDVTDEFSALYVVDLGGDVRANPKLSGTKHNVFGIQTGVAIAFLVKKKAPSSALRAPSPARGEGKSCAIFYARRPEMETAEDKLAWLGTSKASSLAYEHIAADTKHNWVNLSDNDWDTLVPVASKATKAGKRGAKNQAIFQLFSSGLKSQRDEWVYDPDRDTLAAKMRYLVATYEATRLDRSFAGHDTIKWDAELDRYSKTGVAKSFDDHCITRAAFRPFTSEWLYFDRHFNGRTYQLPSMFPPGVENRVISFSDIAHRADFCVGSFDGPVDLHYGAAADGYQIVSRYRYTPDGTRIDNITDWALKELQKAYGKRPQDRDLSKDAIFHYVYGVLHDPVYRETYAQNLKREFPRVPFYPDFWRWADWGEKLMALHIGYESVEPWPLTRIDVPDAKSVKAGVSPRVILKADRDNGIITLDSETQLTGVPGSAWEYRLGNRSGLDWILDQHKEKKPKDPTIREKFNTYRFADHREKVVDLLMRVTRVSVETVAITQAMRNMPR